MLQTFNFSLPGITCINCIKPVEEALDECQLIKINSYSSDVTNKSISITVELDVHSINDARKILIEAIEGRGVDCVELVSPNSDVIISIENLPAGPAANSKNPLRSHLIKGTIGTVAGVALMAIMLSEVAIPLVGMYVLVGISSLLTLILGASSYYDAAKKLFKSRVLTMDALFTISTFAVIGESIASFFIHQLNMRMESGLFIFGFRNLGLAIEDSVKQKVISGMSFQDRANTLVKRRFVEDDLLTWKLCHTNVLAVDDIIRLDRNSIVPVDGVCVSDNGMLYKTIITGETLPAAVRRGDAVLAGMKVPSDQAFIDIQVKKLVSGSYLARLDEKISKVNTEKAPIEITANKILQYFILGVLSFTSVSAAIIYLVFKDYALTIEYATSLLVSACPCTLGLITPLAVKIGMTKALGNGVQFKNSKTLQEANMIDTIVLDLNGTLTTGVPTVIAHQIYPEAGMDQKSFFNYLFAIENQSNHPIAKAIAIFALTQMRRNTNIAVDSVDLSNHSGIKAVVGGEVCLIGNIDFLTSHKIEPNENIPFKHNTIYFVKSGQIIGEIQVEDPLREDAQFTIHELTRMGKHIYICTGADEKTAQRYAEMLKIPSDHVYAQCLGDSMDINARTKANVITTLKSRNKHVAMVGDAGNDAVAIAKSDFGIAVKSQFGDIQTQEQAGAVIDNTSLILVVTTFAIANQTVSNIKQNLIISFVYNLLMLAIEEVTVALYGFALHPSIGVGLMILQMTLMLLNQNRIKNQPLPYVKHFDDFMRGKPKSITHVVEQNDASNEREVLSERTPLINH